MDYIRWIRSQAGHRKIFLAFASIVLFDSEGRILLQCRADLNVWGLPGGALERGENILECGHRELAEESGLSAGDLQLVGVYSDPCWETVYPNGDRVQQYTVCFSGKVTGGQMQVDGTENLDQRFFPQEDLPYDDIPPWYQAMLADALQRSSPAFQQPFSLEKTEGQIETIRPLIGHAVYIGTGACAVVTNEAGQILMGRRGDDGGWDFPGGYANLGENIAYTAVREVREECGIEIVPERILGIFSPKTAWTYPNGDQTQTVLTVFKARLTGGMELPDGVETLEVRWMSPQEVSALEMPAAFRPLVSAVLDHLEGGYFVI